MAARLRPRRAALPGRLVGRCDRRRLLHDRAQHQPVHLPRQPSARPVAGGDVRSWPRRRDVPHDEGDGDPAIARRRAARRRRRRDRLPRRADRPRRHRGRVGDAVPVPGRRRLPRRVATAALPARPTQPPLPGSPCLVLARWAATVTGLHGRPAARGRRGRRCRCRRRPTAASSTARATSLHVHVFTCRPASWQRSTTARSTVGSHGCMAAWPASATDATSPAVTLPNVSQPVGNRGSSGPAAIDRLAAERRDQPRLR